MHVHEVDTLGPIFNQTPAESFSGNGHSLQVWVAVERKDGDDAGSAVDDVDLKGIDSLSDIAQNECNATRLGPEGIGDGWVEGVSE